MKTIETARLQLRTFQTSDVDAMTLINQDPKVMKYFPTVGDRAQTMKLIERIITHQEKFGYSPYAVEIKSSAQMIEFVGLLYRTQADFNTHFVPSVEMAWRLSSQYWNQGYATEAALAVLHYAFKQLNLTEVVSFTVPQNLASRRIMEKIGLKHCPDQSFDHPHLKEGHPLRPHALYRLTRSEYEQ